MVGSITLNFHNLGVVAQPELRTGSLGISGNCDTTFSYSLSSAQTKNCQVVIKIYDMAGNVVKQTTLTQLCPGNYIFTWDGTISSGSTAPAGLYTFDILVNGKTPDGQVINEDKNQMRSSLLRVQQTYMDIDCDNPGKFKFGYVLESADGKLPSELEVKVYGSALENFVEKATIQGGKKVIPPSTSPTIDDWNFVSFLQDLFQVGGALEVSRADRFYAVVVGKDDSVNNKIHNRKPILERNQEGREPTAALFSREWECMRNPGYQAMVEAKTQLCSGVFKKDKDKNVVVQDAFKFAEKWKYPSDNGFTEVPMIVAWGNEEHYSVATLVKALKNVDVFAYAGPGDGNAILLGDNKGTLAVESQKPSSRPTNYPNLVLIDNVILNGALANLHLVVVCTCKWGGYDSSPVVQKLVNKGAKFGIHLTGPKPAQNPQNKYWEINNESTLRWSILFWEAVTKGYTKNREKVYPTMAEAAIWARDEEITRRKREKKKDPVVKYWPLEVFTYGDKELYLGDISLK